MNYNHYPVGVRRHQPSSNNSYAVERAREIAKKLDRHRSTVEKHLRVLLKAGIVEKVPSLTKAGQLSVRYKVCDNAAELLKTILDVTQKI
jgi:predicted transcriptional regulator